MARTLLRLVTVLAVFVSLTIVQLPVSHAIETPRTLADRRPVTVGPVVPPLAIEYVGVLWDTRERDAGRHARGTGGAGGEPGGCSGGPARGEPCQGR